MYEREEERLRKMKQRLEDKPIPLGQLHTAIVQCTDRAKQRQKRRNKRKKQFLSIAVLALVICGFVTSVRISPAFANAVASIPGMNRVVELIQWDRCIEGIVNEGYYEVVGASATKDGLTITISHVLLDEKEMIVHYTMEAPFDITSYELEEVIVKNDGIVIQPSSLSYNSPDNESNHYKTDLIRYMFLETESFDSQQFEVELYIRNKEQMKLSIPFTLTKAIEQTKQFTVDQKIEVEGQKLTIETVSIFPTRIEVIIDIPKNNDMRLLTIEDLRIEDENGNEWGAIQDGVIKTENDDGKISYFLQSNYFEQPKRLFLKLNRIQALPKGQDYLLIDLQKKKVLEQPENNVIDVTDIQHNAITMSLSKEANFDGNWIPASAFDANEENVSIEYETNYQDESYIYRDIGFRTQSIVNPVKIPFAAYPRAIEKEISIELK